MACFCETTGANREFCRINRKLLPIKMFYFTFLAGTYSVMKQVFGQSPLSLSFSFCFTSLSFSLSFSHLSLSLSSISEMT